jgi:YidC/Oxa1 family membrane protein insertase
MQVRIENKGRETLALQDGYVNNVSQSIGPKDAGKNNDRFRVVSLLKEGTSDVKKVKKIKEREVFHDNYQWIALQDKYYALIVKPKSDLSVVYLEKGVFPPHLSFRTKSVVLKPNQVIQDDFIIYVGPKNLKVLKSYDIGFEKIVSFGFFNKISFYLLALLNFFFRLTGNYGIAIILLTCVAKLVLSPLSHKSFKSMKKMQKIQPHIKSMRERHKDNPKKAQVEMMKLYKEHKVNPLGGCLPIVLQMPIFLALFWLLQSAFELRDAPFVFWIHDLSKKDPTYVMPILMGGSMALQQALSPSVVDPAQKKMMMFLPIVMTFLFLNFPAGLVLYWLVNNLLSLAHQKFAHRD